LQENELVEGGKMKQRSWQGRRIIFTSRYCYMKQHSQSC